MTALHQAQTGGILGLLMAEDMGPSFSASCAARDVDGVLYMAAGATLWRVS